MMVCGGIEIQLHSVLTFTIRIDVQLFSFPSEICHPFVTNEQCVDSSVGPRGSLDSVV